MMSDPLVSVILPMFNNASTITATVRSVLDQSVNDLEVIILDDGSSDDSYAVAEQIKDPRIRLYRNESNLGISATRNRGMALMRGTFMAPMDADDTCRPERLALTLSAMKTNAALGACGGWARVHGWGPRPYVMRLPCGPEAVRAYLLYGAPYMHGALLFRRSTYEAHGIRYNEDLRAGVDYDFYYRLAQVSGVDNVPSVLLDYTCNPHGITSTSGETATAQRLKGLKRELEMLLDENVDDAMLHYHAVVGNGTGVEDGKALVRAQGWLERLEAANLDKAVYEPEGFRVATGMVWFRVCRNSAHLGWPAWRAWCESSWSSHARPSWREQVSFLGSWALARVFPSRRSPQGALKGL